MKDNFEITDSNNEQQGIKDIYYYPVSGDFPSSLIRIYLNNEIGNNDLYKVKTSNTLLLDGTADTIQHDVSPTYIFPEILYSLYISSVTVSENNNYTVKTGFINERDSRASTPIKLYTAIIRNNAVYLINEENIISDDPSFSVTSILNGYNPQPGDIIKIAAFEDNKRMIANSCRYIIPK